MNKIEKIEQVTEQKIRKLENKRNRYTELELAIKKEKILKKARKKLIKLNNGDINE